MLFKNAKILVIGDVMLDRYLYGSVNRICPEAPVPVLEEDREELFLGGAGLVVATLRSLGIAPLFLSVVGDDDGAADVRCLLNQNQVSDASFVVEPGRKTTVKSRFFAIHPYFQMLLRLDNETRRRIDAKTESALLATLPSLVAQSDFVIISDYNKGVLTPRVIEETLALCTKNKKPVAVDTKQRLFDYPGVTVAVPNVRELLLEFGLRYSNEDDTVIPQAQKLAQTLRSAVVVKRGEKGATLVENRHATTFAVSPVRVRNVAGAGDIFLAILAAAMASGRPLKEAVALSNYGCGIAIGRKHPSVEASDFKDFKSV